MPNISKINFIPLLSISGLTLVSVSGLIFFKSKSEKQIISPSSNIQNPPSDPQVAPTQVPKSIEHYLLASQQFFTQALDAQNTQKSSATISNLLNRSLTLATEAVRLFPTDYRGFLQRGRLYKSLSPTNSQIMNSAISDLSRAYQLNPSLAEITRELATLYAQKGDAQNTLLFLSKTVSLEPTKAQNFYDLARLQQQTGQINAAIYTYDQLLTILIDPDQKNKIISEQSALKNLISQNPAKSSSVSPTPSISFSLPEPPAETAEPLLQANSLTGLVIAAPEAEKKISVNDLTESNSLSGNATLPAGEISITIPNTELKPNSQVYVSTVSGGKNLTLEVKSKTKDSFTIGLLDPTSENIEFKWWILN
jgi:tetratricopeptide (TPR) repeat protein